MIRSFLLLFSMFSMSLLAQINTQGVLSNDQALLIAQQDGYQTLNVPIFSRYDGITTDQARILDALKRNYIIEYSVVDPVNQIITTEITYTGREFIAANLNQGNVLKTYLAVALVEVDRVLEVRQHQTKNNAQTVDYQFRVLNNSKVGKALKWFQEGNTLTHTVDFINTSNGWKKDMDDRNDPTITSYRSSRYGSEGLSSYKSKLKDIEFVNNIETNIIGRWERSTDKEKKREHYIFNEDGTYTNYKARKDITTQGKYKFSTNLGDKIYVSLIPKEGKNTSKSLQRSKWGMYIGGVPFRKEGSATSTNSKKVDPTALAESQQKILERKKKLYSNKIPGFWKSPSGKTTLDIRENKTLILKTKKFTYENATYDINILNGKLNLVIFDKDLVEVFNQELKVVRDDQMVLGGRTYTKF